MNLDELAKKYGGSQVQTGASRFDDLAKKYGGTSLEAEIPQPAPVKDAGFSLGDLAKSFGIGAAGSTKALTDVAGAGNIVSSKLEGATESIQRSLTPERQAELERQAARMKAAEESGSILQEIKAGALNVAEAPLQSAAQAIGSFVPYLPAMFAAPAAAAMRLTAGSQAAIRAVAQQAPKVIGTAQGAGAVKGSIYDGVLRAEVEAGVDPEVARQKADAAQSYFGGNFDQIALGGGLGFVAGSSGVERFLTPAGRVGAAQGMGRRVGEAVVKESLPEAAQGGQERLAQNIALQREGYDVDTFKGVAGAATQEALTGALGAAPIAALAKPDTTAAAKKEQDKFKQEEEQFRKEFGETKPVEVKEPELPTEFPGGYTATRRELSRQDVPESYGIFPEGVDKPLTTVKTQEEAQAKLQTLTEIRAEEQARLAAESEKISADVNAEQRKLDVMEATGQTDTDQYVQVKAAYEQKAAEATQRIDEITQRIADYSTPLTLAPVGSRTDVQNDYVVKRGDQEIGAFPTLEDVGIKLRELEPEAFKQAEQKARVETDDRIQELKQTLTPMLAKFGLQDVGLNVVEKIENDAGGSYLDRLINISLTEDNPIQTMRHEAMHALKDLQFFTPQQWKALTERANKQWIKQYLADVPTELNGVQMSRLDAYKQLGLTQEEIVEEAISDAFGAYDRGATPPPGMIAALFKKLKNFFLNFGQALRGAGFESADDVFQRVERGELKSRKPKSEAKAEPKAEPKEPVKAKEPAEKEPVKAESPEAEEPAEGRKQPVQEEEPTAERKEAKQSLKAKAEKYAEENGIMPYVSEGTLDLPTKAPKYSLQKFNPEKHLSFDPTLGVPINRDGTVTVYYHTTKAQALAIGKSKIIPAEGRNRVYLTNESGGDAILRNRGSFDQELDGSTVLVYVTPDMLQVDAEYDNGRRDFFIPLEEGDFFNKKMKMQSIQKGREEAITGEFSYSDHEAKMSKAVKAYKEAPAAERRKMLAQARKTLKSEHNVGSLLSENGKLEKTRVGEYGLDYEGNSVASQGLGLAAAQKITDKVSTCPRSAICEGLCLGETSGGNFLFGGTATEDVADIKKSAFRAGPRMMQYLKTEALIINPEAFAILLQAEIDSLKKWSASPTQVKIDPETKKRVNVEKEIYQPAVRLNVTSDFKPEMFRAIIEGNPDVQFYDYTKLGNEPLSDNHHLTYSSTGFGQIVNGEKVFFKTKTGQYDHNWATMRKRLNNGQNVAMAFSSKSALPKSLIDEETRTEYRIWDGDDYDARFLDPKQPDGKGMIIGLRNKAGNLSEKNATERTGGFFVQYNPKTDGDIVVVPDQAQFKDGGRKVVPITKEKFSLRAPVSPAFKQWFGDSKIVDDDGKPKVMYHGLAKDTTDFTRKTERGAPIFLTDDPDFANKFAADSFEAVARNPQKYLSEEQIAGGMKRAIAAIRKDYGKDSFGKEMIESLKTGDLNDANPEAKEYVQKELINLLPTGPHIMPLYVRAEKPFDYDNASHVSKVIRWMKENNGSEYIPVGRGSIVKLKDLSEVLKSGNWEAIEADDIQEAIKETGYDSFYVKEHGRKNLAVYEPNQVKSATGNTGQYSRTDNDVRYSLKNVGFPSAKAAKEAVAKTSIPDTAEFKRFIAGNQWVDKDGDPKVFYHATAGNFVEFDPDLKVVYLSDTPEAAEPFGQIAEDRLRQEIYRALNKQEKIDFFQRVVDDAVKADKMSEAEASDFIRRANRKIPEYGNFGDIEAEVMDALLDLSPTRMSIMPLYVRAETPFDFENKDHVAQVINWVKQNVESKSEFAEKKFDALKGSIVQGTPQAIESEGVQRALKRFGFDGYTVRKRGQEKSYAVYNKPEQVQLKSVTGNLGEFSRESKNIKYSLPTIPQNLQDRINETTTRRERKTFFQNIIEAISPTSAADFRAKYLNRYNQMSVYDKKLAEQMGGAALLADQSAESAALMSDLGAGVAASAMGFEDRNGGIPVLRNGITTIDKSVKGLIASLAPLAQYGDPVVYQHYQYWAMVKRGQRLNKEGKLTGIDTADVAFAKMLEQKYPEFVSVQKDLIAFNNGLVQYMVDTGVLSKERGQIYTKHADYVPFYRQMDGDQTLGPNLFQSLSGVKPPKKLKGAVAEEAPLADFLETMVRNTQSSIQAGIKNYAAQRAVNVAVQLKVPGMGAERLNTKENGPNIINVLEKGELVSYRTPDPLLVNAMMSLNQSELPFIGFLSAPADWLRTLVTKEPGFMMANMMRDSLSAWVTSGQKMTPIAGTVINFGKGLARKSPGFEAMLDAGIIGGYEFSENIEKSGFKLEDDLAKKAGKKDPILLRPFTSVWDALGKGTTASDAATRALIYERVLADTGNEAEALYRSLEVMNFHRKGSSPLIRVLTAAVPFFNARLQGLDLFYRASTGNMNNKDAASIQRQFFLRGMTMMALSGLYWMLVSDDEEYKKQEQETKDNNWIIPAIGAKIPIPFEVGVLFKVIPERIMAYSFGNDTGEDLQKSMIRAAVSTFAFNPIPQTVKPVLEAVVDYNMFTMRPILGQGMKDVEPEFQVGPSTSNFATVLAQSLGLSPIKVDHIIKGYTGTIGMYAIDTIDIVLDQFGDSPKPTKRFEQLPVIKRFASDPEARGFVTQYYELKDAVDTTVRTMNLLEKTAQPEEYTEYLIKNQGTLAFKDYVRDTERTMTYLREMKVAIRSSTMTGDEKRDALLEISRMESAITSNIQEIKKAIAQSQ